MLGPLAVGAGAAVGLRHLRRSRRSDADLADPLRRRVAAAGECGDRGAAARHHRARGLAGGAGAPHRPRRRPAACAHRRPVLDHRRGAGDPGGDRGQRHARPRPRPAVLDAHPRRHREFADRRRSLFARSRADRALRHHGDGVRSSRAASRCSTKTRASCRSSSPSRPRCAALPPPSCSTAISRWWRAPTSRSPRPSRCRRAMRCRTSRPASRRSCCCPTRITWRRSSSWTNTTTAISTSRGCSIRASCRNCRRRGRASPNMPRSSSAASACRWPSR